MKKAEEALEIIRKLNLSEIENLWRLALSDTRLYLIDLKEVEHPR